MNARLVSLGMLSCFASLGGSARGAAALDQNRGSYTDSFLDSIGVANIAENHDVTVDAAADRVVLVNGQSSGQLATVAVRPASYSGWRRVYLAYGAAAATDLEVRILGSDGQTYGPFAVVPSDDASFSGMADISTVPAALERANVLIHMAEHVFVVGAPDDPQNPDPGDPSDIHVRPALDALRLTWAPKALVKLAVTATGGGLGAPGSREQVHVRVSVSVVDADDLVVYVPTPAPALDARGMAVSLFGPLPAEQTIHGMTVPAGSQIFRLGKRKAGSSFSIDFEIVRPTACLAQTASFPVVVHAVAANAPDLAQAAATYGLAANYGDPKASLLLSPTADFVTIGDWGYEPEIGLTAPPSYLPLGDSVRYDLQAGDAGGCAPAYQASVVWASVERPTETWPIWSGLTIGRGGAYTDGAANVNGVSVPAHSVYWDLDALAAQNLTPELWFAFATRTVDDQGARIPDDTQVAVRARVESRTQPQTAEAGFQFLLGIRSVVDVRVAAGDGIGKSVSVTRAKDDNADLRVGIGESVMLFARADNKGTTRVDDVLIVDQVPAGTTFVSASMLGQTNAVIYYQTGGADSAPSAPPDAVVLTNTLGPSWTTAPPADPSQVHWVAYRVAALGAGAFRAHAPREDATGVMVVTVDPTPDNCSPLTFVNQVLVHARLKTELGSSAPVPIDDTVADWKSDSDPVAVVPKLPNFNTSWAGPEGATVRGGSEQSFVFGLHNYRQSLALTDVANNTDVRVALPTLPDGTSFPVASIDADGGMIDYGEFPAAVTIHYGAFPAGASRTVTVRVRAPRGALPGTPMNLIATVSGQSARCGAVRKGLAAYARTTGNANVELAKDVDLAVARPGSQLTYTLSYINVGDAAGQGTWLVDRIRPGTTFAWATVPAGREVWFSNRPTLPDSLRADGAPLDEAAIRAQFVRGVAMPDGHYGPPASMTTAPTWIAYATDDATLTPPQMPIDHLTTATYAVTINENDPLASEGVFIANEAAIFGRDLLAAIPYEAATLISHNPSLDLTQECPAVVSAGEYFWATLGYLNNSTNDDLGVVLAQTASPELSVAWADHAFNPLAVAHHPGATVTPIASGQTTTYDITGALAGAGGTALTTHEGGRARILAAPALGTPSGTFVSVRGHAVAAGGLGTFPYEAYARCQVLVENADLFARLFVDQAEPVQDETVSLVLGVSNEGAHDVSGTDIALALPPGLEYVSGSARSLTPGWTIDEPVWDDAQRVLAWRANDGHGLSVAAAGPGPAGWMPGHSDAVLVLVRAHVGAQVTPGSTLPTHLTLSAATGEDGLYTNEATVALHTPLPSPWVRLTAPVVARPGDAIPLELHYGNLSRQVTGPIAVIERLFDGPVADGSADVLYLGSAATQGEALWFHDAALDAPAPAFDPADPAAGGWRSDPAGTVHWIAVYRSAWTPTSEATVTVHLQLRNPISGLDLQPGTTVTNGASLAPVGGTNLGDANPNDNTSTATTKTPGVDLEARIACDPEGANPGLIPGDPMAVTVTIVNSGTTPVYGLKIDAPLPSWFVPSATRWPAQVEVAGGFGAPIDPSGQPLVTGARWSRDGGRFVLGSADANAVDYYRKIGIVAGARVSLTVAGHIADDVANGTAATYAASVGLDYRYDFDATSGLREEVTFNNTASCGTVVYRADPMVVKHAAGLGASAPSLALGGRFEGGEHVRFDLEYNNLGGAAAAGAVLTDDLPENAPFVTGSLVNPPDGAVVEYDDGSGDFAYAPSLAPGTPDPAVRAIRVRWPGDMAAPVSGSFGQTSGSDFARGTTSGTTVSGDAVALGATESGTYTSPPIPEDEAAVSGWDRAIVSTTTPAGASVTVDVLDADTGRVLLDDVTPDASGAIALGGLDPTDAQHLQLRANLMRGSGGAGGGCAIDPAAAVPLESLTPFPQDGTLHACDHGDTFILDSHDRLYEGRRTSTGWESSELPLGGGSSPWIDVAVRSELIIGSVSFATGDSSHNEEVSWRKGPDGWVMDEITDGSSAMTYVISPEGGVVVTGTGPYTYFGGTQWYTVYDTLYAVEPGPIGVPWTATALVQPATPEVGSCRPITATENTIVANCIYPITGSQNIVWSRDANATWTAAILPWGAGYPPIVAAIISADRILAQGFSANGTYQAAEFVRGEGGAWALQLLPLPPGASATRIEQAGDTHVLVSTTPSYYSAPSHEYYVYALDPDGWTYRHLTPSAEWRYPFMRPDGVVLFTNYGPDGDAYGAVAYPDHAGGYTVLPLPGAPNTEGWLTNAITGLRWSASGDVVFEYGPWVGFFGYALYTLGGAWHLVSDTEPWTIETRLLGSVSEPGGEANVNVSVHGVAFSSYATIADQRVWNRVGDCGGYTGSRAPTNDYHAWVVSWPFESSTSPTPPALVGGLPMTHRARVDHERFSFYLGASVAADGSELPTIWRPDPNKVLAPHGLVDPANGEFVRGTVGAISPDGRFVLANAGELQAAIFTWDETTGAYVFADWAPGAETSGSSVGAMTERDTLGAAPLVATAGDGSGPSWFYSPTAPLGFVYRDALFDSSSYLTLPVGTPTMSIIHEYDETGYAFSTSIVLADASTPSGLRRVPVLGPNGETGGMIFSHQSGSGTLTDSAGDFIGSVPDLSGENWQLCLWKRTGTYTWTPIVITSSTYWLNADLGGTSFGGSGYPLVWNSLGLYAPIGDGTYSAVTLEPPDAGRLTYVTSIADGLVVGGAIDPNLEWWDPDKTKLVYWRHLGGTLFAPVVLARPTNASASDTVSLGPVGPGPVFFGTAQQNDYWRGTSAYAWAPQPGETTVLPQSLGATSNEGYASYWLGSGTTASGVAGHYYAWGASNNQPETLWTFEPTADGVVTRSAAIAGAGNPLTIRTSPYVVTFGGQRPWVMGCASEPPPVTLDDWRVIYRTASNPSLSYELQIPDLCQAQITNTASITTTTPEISTDNDASTIDVPIATADVSVALQADHAAVVAGDTIGYHVVVSNDGPSRARDVTLAVTLPSGDGSPGIANTQSLGSLGAGEVRSVDFTVPITTQRAGVALVAHARVDTPSIDCDAGNDAATATTLTGLLPNVYVEAEAPPTAPANSEIDVAIVVGNDGNTRADDVVVTHTVEAGHVIASFDAPPGVVCSVDDATLTCALGSLDPGEPEVVTVHVGSGGGCIDATDGSGGAATVQTLSTVSAALDIDGSDNSASTTTRLEMPRASLALALFPSRAQAATGDRITYVLDYAAGPSALPAGTDLALTIPTGTALVDASATPGVVVATDPETHVTTAHWTLPALRAQAVGAVALAVQVNTGPGANIVATAHAELPSELGICPADTTAEPVSIDDHDGLEVTLQASHAVTCTGPIEWALTVTNRGASPATGVRVTAPLAALSPYVAHSIRGLGADDSDPSQLAWNAGTLAPGESLMLGYASAAPVARGVLVTGRAEVAAGGVTAVAHAATVAVRADCKAVRLTKRWDALCSVAGGAVAVELVAENLGTEAVSGVAVSDPLEPDFGFVGFAPDSADAGYDAETRLVTRTFGALAPGEEARLHFTVTAPDAAAGALAFDTARLTVSGLPSQVSNQVTSVLQGCADGDRCTVDTCVAFVGCQHGPMPPDLVPDAQCDGVDDDCDGFTDEDFVPSETTCGISGCATYGVLTCPEGASAPVDTCTPLQPPSDDDATCDGIDDDCDGQTDEDAADQPTTCGTGACTRPGSIKCVDGMEQTYCTEGDPSLETCNGIDDDCNDLTDEGIDPTPTTCGTGACAAEGNLTCPEGAGHLVDDCTPGPQLADDDATCDGIDDDCDGLTDEDAADQPTACGTGACTRPGTITCTAGHELTACTAGDPTPETCNGLDDDCDGQTDDGIPATPTACGTGACSNTGDLSCPAGAGHPVDSCTPKQPLAADDATCDGIDDDCDGLTDEDAADQPTACGTGACTRPGTIKCIAGAEQTFCTEGDPSPETCNGLDDDCDGQTDDGIPATPTACGTGACSNTGALSCPAGAGHPVDSCTPKQPLAPSDTTCDGIDDDCDGLTDEDAAPRPTSCGVGACTRPGTITCTAGHEQTACTAGDPTPETCNGLDDDCDGQTDDGIPATPTTCGTGACSNTGDLSCPAGAGHPVDSCTPKQPLAPSDTTCDGIDDDCDGLTDEDAAPRPTSCGVGACTRPGTITCTAGHELTACTAGDPSPETCNGLDDDCDGQTDDGIPATPTACGTGACSNTGALSCPAGAGHPVDSCAPLPPAASTDTTCDRRDDDCDGQTDEDAVPLGTTCGVGACQAEGVLTCQDGTQVPACTPGAPSPETCNGLDDDCDGETDDGIPATPTTCGTGACAASGDLSCPAGAGHPVDSCTPKQALAPADTTCDGIDDDCDGQTDEDYVPRLLPCELTGPCVTAAHSQCLGGHEVGACQPVANDTPCDDGNACSDVSVCAEGVCLARSYITCNDHRDCTSDSCDPVRGCVNDAVPDGTLCDDANACTGNDRCASGRCVGAHAGCAPPDACHLDGACNPDTGICDYAPKPDEDPTHPCIDCPSDDVPPILVCPTPPAALECLLGGVPAELGEPSASDACGKPVTVTNDAPQLFPLGATDVTFTATDSAGNRAQCTTPVRVADTTPPVVTCPAAVTVHTPLGTCGTRVTLTPTARDACSGDAVAILGVPTNELYAPGTYPIVQTAVDPSGNRATCQTTLTVLDDNVLSIACEPTMTVDAPSNLCGYPGTLSADVLDVCAPDLTVSSSADRFPVGPTDVTFKAHNERGQDATCVTHLTVRDVTLPTVHCGIPSGAVTVPAVFSAEASDACGATLAAHDARCIVLGDSGDETRVTSGCELTTRDGVVTVSAVPARDDAGAVIPIGAVAIAWSVDAVDPSGNLATSDCLALLDESARDRDRDTVPDATDNCPDTPNRDQRDSDLDGIGDRCDDAPYERMQALGGAGCAGGAAGEVGAWAAAAALVLGWGARRRRSG